MTESVWGDRGWDDDPIAYCGPHETIQDLNLLKQVVFAFEIMISVFRVKERREGRIKPTQWEEQSCFSETKSAKIASGNLTTE